MIRVIAHPIIHLLVLGRHHRLCQVLLTVVALSNRRSCYRGCRCGARIHINVSEATGVGLSTDLLSTNLMASTKLVLELGFTGERSALRSVEVSDACLAHLLHAHRHGIVRAECTEALGLFGFH